MFDRAKAWFHIIEVRSTHASRLTRADNAKLYDLVTIIFGVRLPCGRWYIRHRISRVTASSRVVGSRSSYASAKFRGCNRARSGVPCSMWWRFVGSVGSECAEYAERAAITG
jgi:hypothetical protein